MSTAGTGPTSDDWSGGNTPSNPAPGHSWPQPSQAGGGFGMPAGAPHSYPINEPTVETRFPPLAGGPDSSAWSGGFDTDRSEQRFSDGEPATSNGPATRMLYAALLIGRWPPCPC